MHATAAANFRVSIASNASHDFHTWTRLWGHTVLKAISALGVKQGNRLTHRPCKGDKFEIDIFEAKRQNAGIRGTCQKMFATWTFISIGRRVTQVQTFAFRMRGESILFFEGFKKRNLSFSSFP